MNCNKYKKHILSYLDGELHQDMANEFEKHLTDCKNCRAEVDRLKIVYSLIDTEKTEFKPDPFMSTRVLAKLSNADIKTSTNRYTLRYLTIATLAAAGIAAGILIGTIYSSSNSILENTSTNQEWEQLANEYMPEVENNPYNMVTITNETNTKP